MRPRMTGEYYSLESAAKAYAKLAGYAGNKGGWIRWTLHDKRVMCQGWDEFARICVRRGWVVDISLPRDVRYLVPLAKEEGE